jgi:hypothetical protein
MEEKGVVFVYITDPSSPAGTWEKKISEIGGEHYCLTEEESDYIHKKLGCISIPFYVLYDANGCLKNKNAGFPGIKEMQGMIENLLP